jgi:hypothetical protein
VGKHNATITRRASWTWERLRGRGPGPTTPPDPAPEPPAQEPERPQPVESTEAAWLGIHPEPQPRPGNGTAVLPRLAAQERTDAPTALTGPIERVVPDEHEVTVRYPDGRLLRVDTRRTGDSPTRQQWLIAAPTDAHLETGMVVRVDRTVMAVAVREANS